MMLVYICLPFTDKLDDADVLIILRYLMMATTDGRNM
jgi:hypothetical protein